MNAKVNACLLQDTPAKDFPTTLAYGPGDSAMRENSLPDDLNALSSEVHWNLEINAGEEGCSPARSYKFNEEHSEERSTIGHEHRYAHPQCDSGHPVIPKDVSARKCAIDHAGELANLDDAQSPEIACLRESPSVYSMAISETSPRNEAEADPDDHLDLTQILHTGLDRIETTGLTYLTDGEKTCEDFEEFLPSLPPSSSPPHLLSSSPYASSQSSVGDAEASKSVLAGEVNACTNSRDYTRGDHTILVDQHDSESEVPQSNTVEVDASLGGNKYYSRTSPASRADDGVEPSRKRIADSEVFDDTYSTKRPKPDSRFNVPPAPKRSTIAAHHHQFKKLASPFRPPLKLPVVTEGQAQIVNTKKVESVIDVPPEKRRNKTDSSRSTGIIQYMAPKTPRPISQFKSPLVNGVLPTESRTIRLTPALQSLERELQLLKRAVKVKESNEEEVLERLAGKWIEAGRETACEVWEATKDSSGFAGKTTRTRRSYGWESSNDRNTPWGWDTKSGDPDEESCNPDQPEASCITGRPAAEEDDDVGYNTLGNMLRQLGIAPEIFGWNDDKETFSD